MTQKQLEAARKREERAVQIRIKNTAKAEALLRRMVATPSESSMRHYLTEVGERNGVICACDGVIGAVILPDAKDEWDLTDAYIEGLVRMPDTVLDNTSAPGKAVIKEPETGKMDLAEHINSVRDNGMVFAFSAGELESIIDECRKAQAEYKAEQAKLEKHIRNSNPMYATIGLDFDERKACSSQQYIHAQASNYFSVNYLTDALRFILCAKTQFVDVYVHQYKKFSPILLHADNLYAIVCPVVTRR